VLFSAQRHDPAQDDQGQHAADADDEIELGHMLPRVVAMNVLLRTVARFLRAIPLPRAICKDGYVTPELLTFANDGTILSYPFSPSVSATVCVVLMDGAFCFLGACMWSTLLLYVTTIIANLAALGVLQRAHAPFGVTALCYALCGFSGILLWTIITRRLRCAAYREAAAMLMDCPDHQPSPGGAQRPLGAAQE
jgi:hypothetical protein